MSQLVDFKFDQLSRIGNDSTAYTQENMLNINHANYNLYNPYVNNCDGPIDFATQQPNVFFKGTNHVGPGGCNIDQSSVLEKSMLTNNHIKISLHERPYKSVPYLGRGNVDVYVENNLFWGDTLREKKTTILMNESKNTNMEYYPLMDPERYTDSSKHIEQDAAAQWIRGGLPSRDIYKNAEYKNILT
jgi:hypothetical protein